MSNIGIIRKYYSVVELNHDFLNYYQIQPVYIIFED